MWLWGRARRGKPAEGHSPELPRVSGFCPEVTEVVSSPSVTHNRGEWVGLEGLFLTGCTRGSFSCLEAILWRSACQSSRILGKKLQGHCWAKQYPCFSDIFLMTNSCLGTGCSRFLIFLLASWFPLSVLCWLFIRLGGILTSHLQYCFLRKINFNNAMLPTFALTVGASHTLS